MTGRTTTKTKRSGSATKDSPTQLLGPGTIYHSVVHATNGLTTHGRRLGRAEPRLVTPPLRELTPETSLGFEAIQFAEEIIKVSLRPWQKALLIRALETLPDGTFRFRNVVVLVARQNGKSLLSVVLALFFMYVLESRAVLSAAQDLDTAEEIWSHGVALVEELDDEDEPVRPELAAFKRDVVLVNGKKALILTTGERWKVKAANRKAGRGLSGDLIILDELREQQNWHAWSAITKTTMARPLAMVWCFSNAGDITSVVLRHLRMQAHKRLGDPDGVVAAAASLGGIDQVDLEEIVENNPALAGTTVDELEVDVDDLFLAEWSTTPGRSKWDRDGWAESNPSLGYGDTTERAIASACATDPEWEFRTEVLCQWPGGALDGPFPAGKWESTLNRTVETRFGPQLAVVDRIVGDVVACVAVSADRSRAYVLIAGRRADGVAQVELHAARKGVEWVHGWLMARAWRIRQVTGQSNGAQVSDLMRDLAEDPKFTIPVVPWRGPDLLAAHGQAFDAVRDGLVWHNPQMALDLAAAAAAKKKLGDGWLVDLPASPVDAAPLQGFIGALWLLCRQPPQVHLPAAAASLSESSTRGGPDRVASMTSDLASVHF